MTSPPTKVTVECPRCRKRSETWHRPSWNLGVIYLLDWLFPKKRLGTWFLNRIGA